MKKPHFNWFYATRLKPEDFDVGKLCFVIGNESIPLVVVQVWKEQGKDWVEVYCLRDPDRELMVQEMEDLMTYEMCSYVCDANQHVFYSRN